MSLKRSLATSTAVSLLACAACCLVPVLVASGVGGGLTAGLARFFRPGTEIVFGMAAFLVTFAVSAVWARRRAACGTQCARDGSCCAPDATGREAS